eukprot:scaffold7639_cov70-Isochrysis_galbana.AAC.2
MAGRCGRRKTRTRGRHAPPPPPHAPPPCTTPQTHTGPAHQSIDPVAQKEPFPHPLPPVAHEEAAPSPLPTHLRWSRPLPSVKRKALSLPSRCV